MRRTGIRRTIVVLVAAAFALLSSASAHAQSLSITAATVSDFSPVSLSGSLTTTTATMSDFSVTDSRVVSDGWNVVVQGTAFREWDGSSYPASGKKLPIGSLSMPAPKVSVSDPLAVQPTITPGPYLIDGYSVKIASAGPGVVAATYTFTQTGPLTLTVVAGAYARTYRSEITVSVASGP